MNIEKTRLNWVPVIEEIPSFGGRNLSFRHSDKVRKKLLREYTVKKIVFGFWNVDAWYWLLITALEVVETETVQSKFFYLTVL